MVRASSALGPSLEKLMRVVVESAPDAGQGEREIQPSFKSRMVIFRLNFTWL